MEGWWVGAGVVAGPDAHFAGGVTCRRFGVTLMNTPTG